MFVIDNSSLNPDLIFVSNLFLLSKSKKGVFFGFLINSNAVPKFLLVILFSTSDINKSDSITLTDLSNAVFPVIQVLLKSISLLINFSLIVFFL